MKVGTITLDQMAKIDQIREEAHGLLDETLAYYIVSGTDTEDEIKGDLSDYDITPDQDPDPVITEVYKAVAAACRTVEHTFKLAIK